MIDLHLHTNQSDGELSPEKLVDLAVQSKLKTIAITDHDTISGCQPAIKYAKEKNIEVIPGIEISCYEEEKGFIEIHIIGLFINYYNQELIDFCDKIKKERINQKKKMIEKLQKFGFDITFEEAIKTTNHSFGRPHLAKILVKKYPKKFQTIKSVFDQYLGNGKPAYVERSNKTKIKDVINLIKNAGGVSILAHPGVYNKQSAVKLIQYFIESGGQGIETYYPYDLITILPKKESNNRNHFFQKYAEEHNLLQSGGSDFHGQIRKTVKIGQLNIPYNLVIDIKKTLNI